MWIWQKRRLLDDLGNKFEEVASVGLAISLTRLATVFRGGEYKGLEKYRRVK